MGPEELKTIVDQVAAAVAARTAPPPPPAVPMQPLSTMIPPPSPVATPPAPMAVMVPLTIGMPDGSEVGVYVQLDGSAVQNLPQIVAQMIQTGWPVRTWQPKQNTGGWGNNRGYGRRSWRS